MTRKIGLNTIFTTFIGCILFFFVCNRLVYFAPSGVETLLAQVVHPVLELQHRLLESWKKRAENKKSIEQLQQELLLTYSERDLLRAQVTELQATTAYARTVQELLAFKNKYEQPPVCLATIILRQLTDTAHYVLIDAGQQQGVDADMVAVYQNQLVGRVAEVWPKYSKVVLITDVSCKVGALCVGSNIQGIHEGECRLDRSTITHVSHLLPVQEQEAVLTSGQGLVFPFGLALGVITTVTPAGMYQEITVKPLVDIRAIEAVWILPKKT